MTQCSASFCCRRCHGRSCEVLATRGHNELLEVIHLSECVTRVHFAPRALCQLHVRPCLLLRRLRRPSCRLRRLHARVRACESCPALAQARSDRRSDGHEEGQQPHALAAPLDELAHSNVLLEKGIIDRLSRRLDVPPRRL